MGVIQDAFDAAFPDAVPKVPANARALGVLVDGATAGRVTLKMYGAAGDGETPDGPAILDAIVNGGGPVTVPPGDFYVDAPVAPVNGRIDLRGSGGALSTDQQSSIIRGIPTTPEGREAAGFSQAIGLLLRQPYFGGSGEGNNHATVAFSGLAPLAALLYGEVDIGITLGYGPNTAPRNAWGAIAFANRLLASTMGIEISSGYTATFGNTVQGNREGHARAASHGLRLLGYSTNGIDPNIGNVGAAESFKDMLTGISIQSGVSHANHSAKHATNCFMGVQFTEANSVDDVQRHNYVNLTGFQNDYDVYLEGAEYNVIEVNASESANFSINAIPGVNGTGGHNTFRGTIRNGGKNVDRMVNIAVPDANLDLTLLDYIQAGTRTAAIVISGARAKGCLVVDGSDASGVRITGDDANLAIKTRNVLGSSDVIAIGNNAVLDLDCAGNVTIQGSNCIVRGRIRGNLTVTGPGVVVLGIVDGTITGRTNGDFSGVRGERYRVRVSRTTDASGDFTVDTGFGATNALVAFADIVAGFSSGVSGWCQVRSISNGVVTFRAYNTAGAALASTALSVSVMAERYG